MLNIVTFYPRTFYFAFSLRLPAVRNFNSFKSFCNWENGNRKHKGEGSEYSFLIILAIAAPDLIELCPLSQWLLEHRVKLVTLMFLIIHSCLIPVWPLSHCNPFVKKETLQLSLIGFTTKCLFYLTPLLPFFMHFFIFALLTTFVKGC